MSVIIEKHIFLCTYLKINESDQFLKNIYNIADSKLGIKNRVVLTHKKPDCFLSNKLNEKLILSSGDTVMLISSILNIFGMTYLNIEKEYFENILILMDLEKKDKSVIHYSSITGNYIQNFKSSLEKIFNRNIKGS